MCHANVTIKSQNINGIFFDIVLKNISHNDYQYLLNLNLSSGLDYQLEIQLSNNRYYYSETISPSKSLIKYVVTFPAIVSYCIKTCN